MKLYRLDFSEFYRNRDSWQWTTTILLYFNYLDELFATRYKNGLLLAMCINFTFWGSIIFIDLLLIDFLLIDLYEMLKKGMQTQEQRTKKKHIIILRVQRSDENYRRQTICHEIYF